MTNLSAIDRSRTIAVAPMLAYTNRHMRFLYRLLSPNVLLYTEMIHAMSALSKKRRRYMSFSPEEHPIVVQLAGNDAQQLADAAKVCEDYGYDEINLNIGCPSNKVRQGAFGACLMSNPEIVADVIHAMSQVVNIPISVKCRLGIDDQNYKETLPRFIDITQQAGCSIYNIHARMAWLKGLSPRQNRDVPPLDYDYVYQIKKNYPHLFISINGGIQTIDESLEHLQHVDGVMLGRAILSRPALLQEIEKVMFGGEEGEDIIDIIRNKYAHYAQRQLADNSNAAVLTRPLFPLFAGVPGGGIFRRRLAQRTDLWQNPPEVFDYALEAIDQYPYSNTENTISI